jgi:hypothetical protein
MSVLTGLDAIRKAIESRPKGFDNVNDRELTRNIKTGESRTIRFLQELDPEAKHYDERYGTGLVVSEHQHPNIWWLLLVDTTSDEGTSFGAENGWPSKLNLYINVVDVDTGEVFYLSRSVLGGLGEEIVESAGARGSLTDSIWKISKKGQGMNTKYKLSLVNITDEPIDVDTDKLIDFNEQVLNNVPAEEQEAYIKQVEQRVKAKAAQSDTGAPAASDDSDEDDVW